MKTRALSLTILALLLSAMITEARSRRAPGVDGGPLAQDRGLAEGESAAVGVVLRGVTGTQAEAPATAPSRRYSPDYYRAYPQRLPAAGAAKKVAVTPVAAKPAPTPPRRVAVAKVAPAAPAKVARASTPVPKSKITPVRVAVLPRGMNRSGAVTARVAAPPKPTPAPRVAKVKIAPAPTPPARPKNTPLRVAVLPRGMDRSGAMVTRVAVKPTPAPAPKATPRRVAVLPRRAPTPPVAVAKPRKVATQPTGPEPVRVLFRE